MKPSRIMWTFGGVLVVLAALLFYAAAWSDVDSDRLSISGLITGFLALFTLGLGGILNDAGK